MKELLKILKNIVKMNKYYKFWILYLQHFFKIKLILINLILNCLKLTMSISENLL
jgi:hypothetical protein